MGAVKKKKIIKTRLFTLFFSVMFIISLFMGLNALAETNPFRLTNVTIEEKSDTVTGTIENLDIDKLESDITFHKLNDYVKYKITLKSNINKDITIISITDDNNNKYVAYEYDNLENKKVTKDSSFDFIVKAIYKNELNDTLERNQTSSVRFTINYLEDEEVKQDTITINPKTGDTISKSFIILMISSFGLVTSLALDKKRKKKKLSKTSVFIITGLLLTPILVKATTLSYGISLISNYGIYDKLVVTIDDKINDPTKKTIKYNTTIDNLPSTTKEGYTLTQWTVKDKEFDITKEITEDITIEANYTPITYNIKFDPNGGQGEMDKEEFKYDVKQKLTKNIFTNTGYDFIGWGEESSSLTSKYIDEEEIENLTNENNKEITLYAIWSPKTNTKYKIIHKYQNIDLVSYTDEEENLTGTTGEEVTPNIKPKTGFILPNTQTITISADGSTEVNYIYNRVKYNFNVSDRTYLDSNSTKNGEYPYGSEIILKANERNGYIFKWSDDNNKYERTIILDSDLELSLDYNIINYTIEYDLDGENVTNPESYNVETNSFTLNNPKKIGYLFTGWTGSNGTIKQTTVTINKGTTGNLNYKAHYSKISSDITINVSNENVITSSKQITLTVDLTNTTSNDVKTEYSIDNGTTWNNYNGPFTITSNRTIKARTILLADNITIGESEKEITNIQNVSATLTYGVDVNKAMKRLSGMTNPTDTTNNTTITSIKRYSDEPSTSILNSAEIVSSNNSLEKIYMWFDNGTIYYYSKANVIKANSDGRRLFSKFQNLSTIELINELDTSDTTTFYQMFDGDPSLTQLDLSNFNTSNVTNMESMFYGCTKLKSLNLSGWDTSKVTIMYQMFHTSGLNDIDLSSFNTSKVTNMQQMFYRMPNIKNLDLSSFDTSNVTNMYQMFQKNSNLESINFGEQFDTGKVTNMNGMFDGCTKITTLDLSTFDTKNVTNMGAMFWGMTNLTTIYASNDFNRSKVTNSNNMFQNDNKLTGGLGTTLSTTGNILDKTYAQIDNNNHMGYFTQK